MRRIFCLALLTSVTVLLLGIGTPTALSFDFDDDELLILAVSIDGTLIHGDLIAYSRPDSVLIPLGRLSQILGFGIRVTPAEGRADGFFLSEERTFELDVPNEKVLVRQTLSQLDSRQIAIEADDIYVGTELLSQWFPITLNVDPYSLVLEVRPHELLPFQQRIERERRAHRLNQRQDTLGGAEASRITNAQASDGTDPKPWLSRPYSSHHIQINLGGNHENKQIFERRYTTNIVGTFLNLDSSIGLAVHDDIVNVTHVRFGREAPNPSLLGFLNARSFTIGDVSLPGIPILSSSIHGRGIIVSSRPRYFPWQYSSRTFHDEIEAGWDVELYHNQVLIGYHGTNDGLHYRFEAPVYYGLNEFTLIKYGPWGQRREYSERVYIDNSLIPPHQNVYRFGALLTESGPAVMTVYEEGINHGTSLNAVFAHIPQRGPGRELIAQLGFNQTLRGVYLSGSIATDESWELTGDVHLAWPFRRGGLAARHTSTSASKRNPRAHLMTAQTRLSGHANLGRLRIANASASFGTFFNVRHEKYKNAPSTYTGNLTVTSQIGQWFVTHRWRTVFISSHSMSAGGSFSIHRRFNNSLWRTHAGYRLSDMKLQNISSSLSWRDRHNTEYNLSALFSPETHDTARISLGVNKAVGDFSLSAHASYETSRTTPSEWNVGLSVSFGTAPHPDRWQWRVTNPHSIDAGSVLIETFKQNVPSGHAAEPLEGIGFYVNNRRHPIHTDGLGQAWITDLPVHEYIEIRVDPYTITDPFLVPINESFRIIPRPGHSLRLDIPFVATGEIDGTVFIPDGDSTRGIAGLRLQLVNEAGTVIQESIAGYDGFYIFSAVIPGKYTVRPDEDDLNRLNLQIRHIPQVEVPHDGSWLSDVNVILIPNN